MIISKIRGGLGNQMFQYALGRVLAIKNHTKLALDLSGYKDQTTIDAPRQYELDIFNIRATKYSQNIFNFWRPRKVISEKSQLFDPAILKLKGNLYLVGYWQSEKYFAECVKNIRQDFTFVFPPSGKNRTLLNDIRESNSVSIHVRRGDYVSNKATNQFHGVCDLAYYQRSVGYIKKHVQNPTFYVFSDDLDWCKTNLKFDKHIIFVTHNQKRNSWEDLRLMSHCKHHIIANSSFSWWGAWLDRNPNKIITAPKNWFKDKKINSRDLIPANWNQL